MLRLPGTTEELSGLETRLAPPSLRIGALLLQDI